MFQFILKQLNKNEKGFTLIELVVVIAILGILAALAVPKLGSSRDKAAKAAHNANVRTLQSAAMMFIADNGIPSDEDYKWDDSTHTEDWEKYLQSWPEVPSGLTISDDEYVVTFNADGKVEVSPNTLSDE